MTTKTELDDSGPKGYAVYDLTYLRFIPGVYESEKDAKAAAKDLDNAEVREV